jgi:hypothetical protein
VKLISTDKKTKLLFWRAIEEAHAIKRKVPVPRLLAVAKQKTQQARRAAG